MECQGHSDLWAQCLSEALKQPGQIMAYMSAWTQGPSHRTYCPCELFTLTLSQNFSMFGANLDLDELVVWGDLGKHLLSPLHKWHWNRVSQATLKRWFCFMQTQWVVGVCVEILGVTKQSHPHILPHYWIVPPFCFWCFDLCSATLPCPSVPSPPPL